MGLDQNIFARPAEYRNFEEENKGVISECDHDFMVEYFRKFNALQGYFENKYRKVHGDDADINLQNIEITEDDVEQLLLACAAYLWLKVDDDGYYPTIENSALKPTEGFFYGSQYIYHQDILTLAKCLKEVRDLQSNGYLVYYTCWY